MHEFIKMVNKMSPEAAKLIFYGLKFATGVLVLGFVAYKYNQLYIESYEAGVMCIEIVKAAFSLFVQFIIGGIAVDCVQKDNGKQKRD